MTRRCDWLHMRYRRRETLTSIDWVCDDCGEVIATVPMRSMRGKSPAQIRRIAANMDMKVGMATP